MWLTYDDEYARAFRSIERRAQIDDSTRAAMIVDDLGWDQCPPPPFGIHPFRWKAMIRHIIRNDLKD